jgi:hypothetical protein
MTNTLRFLKLQITLQAIRDYKPIGYIGKKIRGALGNAMFALYCVHPVPDCEQCERQKSCVYGALFKNPEKSPEFPTFPAPFVIDAPYDAGEKVIKTGETLTFSITILGESVRWWKHAAIAVRKMFDIPEKSFNSAFQLRSIRSEMEDLLVHNGENFVAEPMAAIWSDDPADPDIDPVRVNIEFLSPLITKNARDAAPDFGKFMDAVFYRIASMVDIYEKKEFAVSYGLLYRKPRIHTEVLSRDTGLPCFIFEGNLNRYLPYIDMGVHLHVGKQSTCGYGKCRVQKIF